MNKVRDYSKEWSFRVMRKFTPIYHSLNKYSPHILYVKFSPLTEKIVPVRRMSARGSPFFRSLKFLRVGVGIGESAKKKKKKGPNLVPGHHYGQTDMDI